MVKLTAIAMDRLTDILTAGLMGQIGKHGKARMTGQSGGQMENHRQIDRWTGRLNTLTNKVMYRLTEWWTD